ncbi:TadE-like protein [Tamaricihabitans halophyticus]|uniref:TadE-like protein n=1 Tax=Tamaricihabitans halophyticus TaxID=1262583 RepID=A0A4R2R544_9PSEU|nr:TadE family type IV pilus minor pilin [Tamaricihabitans halophyticus]TCP56848.1 TadE-like protein [Tamaricihabitans halophyticus]
MPATGCALSSGARDRGAVTVEAAIGISALVVVLGLAFAGIVALSDQLRCTDAAREAARLIARGDGARAESVVQRIAPAGAELRVDTAGEEISVQVRAPAAAGLLPGITLRADAYAIAEPADR